MVDHDRHAVMFWLFGVNSTSDLTKLEASSVLDWLKDEPAARSEAASILAVIGAEAGQVELPLDVAPPADDEPGDDCPF